MPKRYIVRFRGSTAAKEIAERLHRDPLVRVVDETRQMVLVEADESDLLKVVEPGRDVVIVPEREYESPHKTPAIEREPRKRTE